MYKEAPFSFLASVLLILLLPSNSAVHGLAYTCKGAIGGCVDDIRDVFLSIRLGIARAVSKIVPPHEVEDIVHTVAIVI